MSAKLLMLKGGNDRPTKSQGKKRTIDYSKSLSGTDTMMGADEDCTPQQLEKFFSLIQDILTWTNIVDDPKDELVECLTKMENQINFYIEARNHLHWNAAHSEEAIDIDKFERDLNKAKVDLKFREFQQQKKEQAA